jgi:ribonuclease HI
VVIVNKGNKHSFKYLGVLINLNLNWKPHLESKWQLFQDILKEINKLYITPYLKSILYNTVALQDLNWSLQSNGNNLLPKLAHFRNIQNTKRWKPKLSNKALVMNPKELDINGNNSMWDLRFTDGSTSKSNSAGAIYLPFSDESLLFKLEKNNYLAELTAIYLAICSCNSKHNLLIYTDSMSSLQAISSTLSSKTSQIVNKSGHQILIRIRDLLKARRGATIIDYIPSHLTDPIKNQASSRGKQLDYRHQNNKICDQLATSAHSKGKMLSIETLLNPTISLKDNASNQIIQENIGKTVRRIFNQRHWSNLSTSNQGKLFQNAKSPIEDDLYNTPNRLQKGIWKCFVADKISPKT